MTVSTYVEANDKAEAMQKGCDLVHPLVAEGKLGVHTVDAKWAPDYMPPQAGEEQHYIDLDEESRRNV